MIIRINEDRGGKWLQDSGVIRAGISEGRETGNGSNNQKKNDEQKEKKNEFADFLTSLRLSKCDVQQ